MLIKIRILPAFIVPNCNRYRAHKMALSHSTGLEKIKDTGKICGRLRDMNQN
jgi:hypothetical protein